jgi:L-ascorbate metabolism protein UlaG (beta-lactamase superfamily)
MSVAAGEPSRITWLGHSTVLLDLDRTRLLTDPVLRPRLLHLRRTVALPDRDTLTNVDAVLVSHLHYDHLDVASLRRLDDSPIVVPARGGRLLVGRGLAHVVEIEIGEEVRVGQLTVRATYAEHDGARGPFGTSAPAVGYVVGGSHNVYFAGDTDLFDGMDALAPTLDVALLPIAGWGPRLPAGHLDPRRAAEALVRLRPRIAVPIHWGTYRRIGLSRDPAMLREPAESFSRFARELAPSVDVHVLPVGGTLTLPQRRLAAVS